MSSPRPDDYANPTEMPHSASRAAAVRPSKTAAGAAPSPVPEQDLKRIEKIRSHASSHHTAGTVTLDV